MDVFIHHAYRASRKEQLAVMLQRILDAFGAAGLVPSVAATFADGPDGGGVSAVDRALKKYPELEAFAGVEPGIPGLPPTKRLGEDPAGRRLPLDAVLALAGRVPRSLPFDSIQVQFGHPEFDGVGSDDGLVGGVVVGDSWWINGRNRSLSAIYTVKADPDAADLPPPPAGVAKVIADLGKPRKSTTSVIPAAAEVESTDKIQAARTIVSRYRTSMAEIVAQAAPPHQLPELSEVLATAQPAGGPLKPALVAAFTPAGFDCRGEPGRFVLRRRTMAGNFEILDIDVGTWSRMVTVQYRVHGSGGAVRLHIPVGERAVGALQYPIGDGPSWERIVANVAAVVDELERTFLPEVEEILGGSPDWFEPSGGMLG
jgi:hypothetical protein